LLLALPRPLVSVRSEAESGCEGLVSLLDRVSRILILYQLFNSSYVQAMPYFASRSRAITPVT
jgi:hypothetical protein